MIDEQQVLGCPVDGETMVRQQHGAGHFHVCRSCRGLWLPRTYLLALKQKAARQLKHLKADPLEAQRHAKPLACPECHSNLVPRMHELVPIDVCGQCRAVWLDGDEILQMAKRSSAKEKRAQARKEYTENYAGAYSDREAAMLHTGDIVDPLQSISEILEWIFSSR